MSQAILELKHQINELENLHMSIEPEDADEHIFVGQIFRQLADCLLEKWHLSANEEDYSLAEAAISKSIEFGRLGAQIAASETETDQGGEFWAFAAQQAASKFKVFLDFTALDQAIDYYSSARQSLDGDSQTKAAVILNLANCLTDRFEMRNLADKNIDDINNAIQFGQQALDKLGRQPTAVSDVSTMFLARYERLGDLVDLQTATNFAEEALVSTDPNDNATKASSGTNYANCLRHRYELNGDRKDLAKAIDLLVLAKHHASSDRSFPKAEILANLSYTLHLRFDALGTGPDLYDAINNNLAALDAAEQESNSRVRPVVQSNLAACLHSYFQAVMRSDLLDLAIATARSALDCLTQNSTERSMCLYNLANMLYDKSKTENISSEAETIAYLEEAILFVEESTHVSNIGHLLVARQHDLWSRVLQAQFEEKDYKNEDVLETAIVKAKLAVDAATHLPGSRADFLIQLGDVLNMKFEYYNDTESFSTALSAFSECASMQSASSLIRIHACHRAASLYRSKEQWFEAAASAEKGVRMLPNLALNALERDSQQRRLEGLSGLSGLAAALALKAGWTAGKAFDLLEAGRGILSRRASQSLALSSLDGKCGELLESYRCVRQKIEVPLTTGWLDGGYHTTLTHEISQRVQDIEHAAQLESQLQAEYGIDLRYSLTEYELIRVASESPIVAFVVTDIRSDALIATSSGVQNLELPSLNLKDCAQHYMTMQMPAQGTLRCLDFESFFTVNDSLKRLLAWLWDTAVLPVLKCLGFYTEGRSDSPLDLPRIHWVTSGILGMMPLHAAGYHEGTSAENTLSHVVSSYTTTVASLRESTNRANMRTWKNYISQLKAVVIGMPRSPEPWESFDLVDEHLQGIKQIIPDESRITYLKEPTRTAALAAILATPIAHFVCHGISQLDPSNSSLILCRGEQTEDGKAQSLVEDPLTVREISNQMPQNLILAFLAACQTADNAAKGLVDENIHIVSSFQILGYANVIGTMWEVEEMASASFAKDFYAFLAQRTQAGGVPNNSKGKDVVVRAFHDAMLSLRQQDPESPVTWATMVCFGA